MDIFLNTKVSSIQLCSLMLKIKEKKSWVFLEGKFFNWIKFVTLQMILIFVSCQGKPQRMIVQWMYPNYTDHHNNQLKKQKYGRRNTKTEF